MGGFSILHWLILLAVLSVPAAVVIVIFVTGQRRPPPPAIGRRTPLPAPSDETPPR